MSVLISNKLQLVIQRIFFCNIMECVIKLQIEEFAQKPAMIGRYLLVERETILQTH